MAAYLLANRLIPADLPDRARLEVSAMFWVWFGLAAVSLVRPARRAWIETLGLAAIAFAALPMVNAATTNRGLVASLLNGDWLFVGFDTAALATGALCGFAAWRAARATDAPTPTMPRSVVRTLDPTPAHEDAHVA